MMSFECEPCLLIALCVGCCVTGLW